MQQLVITAILDKVITWLKSIQENLLLFSIWSKCKFSDKYHWRSFVILSYPRSHYELSCLFPYTSHFREFGIGSASDPLIDIFLNFLSLVCSVLYWYCKEKFSPDQPVIPWLIFFLISHHLSAQYCIDIVRRNSLLVSFRSLRV